MHVGKQLVQCQSDACWLITTPQSGVLLHLCKTITVSTLEF